MDKKDSLGDFLTFRKLKEPGMAWCLTCNMKVNYGSSGMKALIGHSKNHIHIRARKALKSTQSLPGAIKSMIECTEPVSKPPAPYGASHSITTFLKKNNLINANSDQSSSRSSFQCDNNSPRKVPLSLTDRKSHLEGRICAFIAENDSPLSSAPESLEFAKEIAKDPKALNESIGKITVSVSHP